MNYVSTNGTYTTDLRNAVGKCFAPDGSLFMPERLPVIPKAYFNNIEQMSLTEIAFVVANTMLGEEIDSTTLKKVVEKALNFKMPLVEISNGAHVLELFHGPTLAFKDVSARFMANLLIEKSPAASQKLTVLVATTGNTGAALANAFAGPNNINVIVLFPRGSLSRTQLAQISASGKHITAVEVSGSIAKCKALVREAMADESLQAIMPVVCVNTHNVLRILPQIAYFFYAYAQLKLTNPKHSEMVVALPCGNLSNLTSAVMAKRMGLPISHIVAGCSANDDFVRVLEGSLDPNKVNTSSRPTLAKAMDSGYPTNLPRVLYLYNNSIENMRKDISAYSVSDDEIADTMVNELVASGYMCDPHTAIAVAAAHKYGCNAATVIAATAHPAKSLDVMTAITGRAVELPLQLTRFMAKPEPPVKLAPTYQALRKLILNNL
jgi:threonine synthase